MRSNGQPFHPIQLTHKKQSALVAQNPKPRPPLGRPRLTNANSTLLVTATRSSGHASAAPPEKQRDYEQHKEYKKQQFRNARRCSGDTTKAKNRCHKRDD
jgi:hypothetical protein